MAEREQVSMVIDLNDLATHDQDLCDAVVDNSKRYIQLFADVVQEMLPDHKEKEVNHYLNKPKTYIFKNYFFNFQDST